MVVVFFIFYSGQLLAQTFDTNAYYRLTTLYQGDDMALTADNESVFLSKTTSQDNQQWRIEQVTNGVYRIICKINRETKALEVMEGISEIHDIYLKEKNTFDNQLWVISKENDFEDFYRISSAKLTEDFSVDVVYSQDIPTVGLTSTGDYSGQLWIFKKLTSSVEAVPTDTRFSLSEIGEPFSQHTVTTLFDGDSEKSALPTYGVQPQILASFQNSQLMIVWQNHASGYGVKLSSYSQHMDGFAKDWSKTLPGSLDRLSGFTADGSNFYTLTTKNEDMSNQQGWNRRPNIMTLTKIDPEGNPIWNQDLNLSDNYTGENNPVYSPMTAGSADIAYGNGKIAVIYSSNSDYDQTISGRHQSGTRLSVNSDNGMPAAVGQSYSWKHSFDQRVVFDGKSFVCIDQPDAGWYIPGAGIELVKIDTQTDVHHGEALGWYAYARNGDDNFSSINLGQLAIGKEGYVMTFVANKNISSSRENDSRNVGLIHIINDFEKLPINSLAEDGWQPNSRLFVTKDLVDTKKGNSQATGDERIRTTTQTSGEVQSTGIVWLTNFKLSEGITASRPKLFGFGNNNFLILYEEWEVKTTNWGHQTKSLNRTKGMIVDEYGNVLSTLKEFPNMPLRFRDQLFDFNGKAGWVNFENGSFILHTIDQDLIYKSYLLEL
ncbi:RICIN domain-containing protein [Mongoliitalea daihaiensis]|uniref:RICIN domain-containing protein n=1 Tax=Mongoliitalea daihaiensis TaxID=2782006 RepID=UPI001F2F5BC3|nr:RICIN domain-containing protein [Mongoliitalea daihaiensis]UJP64715.1 RICIN domain-containing protein [Mongoliitalea daihaiensis]